MKKKVDVKDLRVGMYIAEVDRPWLETPFLFQGFPLKTLADIEGVRRNCRHVYIDTERGADSDAAMPVQKVNRRIEQDMLKKIPPVSSREAHYPLRASFRQEIKIARRIHRETKRLIKGLLDDIRLGKSVDAAASKQMVGQMVESVIRNPSALVWFTHMKQRDEYTSDHSLNVCVLSLAFARHLGLPREALNEIGVGALLHDVGKMRVPLEILNKAGRLTEEEFELVKLHPLYGREILEAAGNVPGAAVHIAYSHHERCSGKGYPEGRVADMLPFYSKAVAIADVYDAMTSDRVYHDAIPSHEALKKIYEWRNTDFDGELVEKFIQCLGIYPIGSVVELTSGDVGIIVEVNPRQRLKPKVLLILEPDKQPRPAARLIDVAVDRLEHAGAGRPLEIRRVLEPGAYGIDLVKYISEARLAESA